jgi:hypothetical protein
MREEFIAIHRENLMTMKRMVSDCDLEVVQPLVSIQAGIERNLKKIPIMTKKLAIKLNEIEGSMIETTSYKNEKEKTISLLATLNFVQSNESKKKLEELETKKDAEEKYNDLKLSI